MNTPTEGTLESILRPLGGISAFRQSLIDWFRAQGRDYPWRRTKDPYAILVSESMLQQTQIATVLGRGYYDRWMHAFPDWETLAKASEEEVLKAWEGLGYYNRARNLWKTAGIIWHDRNGRFPETLEEMRTLPGIGRYTAGAVMSFSFNRCAALVDGNVSRVLARIFACEEAVNTKAGADLVWSWAEALVPDDEPGLFNSALMELGQQICRPTSPDCTACPVEGQCLARLHRETGRFPIKLKATPTTARDEYVLLAIQGGKVFLCPETGGRRRGLWRLPEIPEESSADLLECMRFSYAITRYKVTLRIFEAAPRWTPARLEEGFRDGRWFTLEKESTLPPLGSPYRKALTKLGESREEFDLKQ